MNEEMDIGKRAEQMVLEHCAAINKEISEIKETISSDYYFLRLNYLQLRLKI